MPADADSRSAGAYRRDVDGLRAVAVLAVLIGHYDTRLLPSGFLGVDVFFVISGFVITGSLAARDDQTWREYLAGFYSRRMRRLLPALVTCILVSSGLGALLTTFPASTVDTGLFALFGASNIYLYKESVDYFGHSTLLNLFTHTWSLGVEEQFYAFFPVLLALCGFARKRTTSGRARLQLVVLGLSLGSLGCFVHLSHSNPQAAFYLLPARFWELGFGCLVSTLTKDVSRPPTGKRLANLVTSIAFVTMLVCFFLPESLRTAATCAVVLLTGLTISAGSEAFVPLSNRPTAHIGRMSYSLYLWHWPLLALVRNHLEVLTGDVIAQLLLATVLLTILSYYYVEKPLRKTAWSASPGRSIVYGLAASALAASAIMGIAWPLRPKLRVVETHEPEKVFLLDEPCHLPKGPAPIDECLRPTHPSAAHVFLMGDSHAGHLLKGLELAAHQTSRELRYLTDVGFVNHLMGDPECPETVCAPDEVAARIHFLAQSMRPGDVLVFSMARERIYSQKVAIGWPLRDLRADSHGRVDALRRNLERVVDTVGKLGGRVLLVEDVPKLCPQYQFEVWTNGGTAACRIGRAHSLDHRQPLSDVYAALAATRSYVSIFDPHPLVCPAEQCTNLLDGELIYSDGSPHLTIAASRRLAPYLEPYLREKLDGK